ncbi:hypothetical protein FC82_GL001726 [Secundilactobacillus collinoides DSM 20515 = JCM 1123]|uniref:Uncharacterized protein n=1 Tax=Secundilactobacillus collinoides DSM 20515 = JCM 1123 TaxID=1423733 RepID=A0A0R2BJ25_SECCO|nr:hypothetical protein FC82_GL001726 [Secundilactobacillus collinoides DSM 20515 = JCM 1123]
MAQKPFLLYFAILIGHSIRSFLAYLSNLPQHAFFITDPYCFICTFIKESTRLCCATFKFSSEVALPLIAKKVSLIFDVSAYFLLKMALM